ncbi:MAG: heterodisulfide reductase [Candidatus Muproteobacteria bacterium RIFCSPHIGHO2_01_FULL_65_16]|uniref:Heterodisulfide reductase n=2 Tax=Candidatus Muproteobacteria TaxID=1817795 RepID=A0A1F6THX5_9PROT|nr:MAG: heterodisulfide reductase [Candidatus Muproteobacteria bacterium RIFCSPHIGHO2_01_FULL_65_16]OGI49390.1 MAG: heterodisulfide reductase [Candidatus Muproteobacteria bacterium RIFCSPHIGHO2_02_FULL_65_16]
MSNLNTAMVERYRNDFLKEVEANVEMGDWVKMCMQCGVCSGSCPLGPYWEHPPQELFMMIRAGKRDEVLKSEAMWMCTSCYNCIVRCPRELPITHIMHGLASYAHRLGLAPKMNPTRRFSVIFWRNIAKTGRVNEMELSLRLYFMDGFVKGVKKGIEMAGVGLGMLRTGRLNPFGLFAHKGCKGKQDIQKMLKHAHEIEAKRKQFA